MGSRVLIKYTESKTGVTVFVYEKMSIYFSEERVLVWIVNVHVLWTLMT